MMTRIFFRHLAVILAGLTVSSCGIRPNIEQPDDYRLAGVLTPRLGPMVTVSPKPTKALQALGKSVVAKSAVRSGGSQNPKSLLESALAREIVQTKGLPRYQISQILSDLVRPQSTACGGASCGRVFGIKASEVEGFLDRAYDRTIKSRSLTSPENADERAYLLASLGPIDDPRFKAEFEKYMPQLAGDKNPTNGTCAAPVGAAYQAATAGDPSGPGYGRNIDFRNSRPKPFQGATGSCHVFSMISMIHHSHHADLQKIGTIDPNRTFLDYWADSLGGTIEEAFDRELRYLRQLAIYRKKVVEQDVQAGILPAMAHDKWRYRAQRPLFMFGQGGHAITDFLRFRLWGVVLEDGNIPPVSIRDLERLGIDLGKARMEVVDRLMESDLLDHEIYAIMKKPLEQVLNLAKENRRFRRPLSNDLGHYTMEKVSFDLNDKDKSIEKFFRALEKNGPLGISRNSHATTVVAYDREQRLFYVADSADRFAKDYTPISEGALFSNLKAYYVLKQTSSPDN